MKYFRFIFIGIVLLSLFLFKSSISLAEEAPAPEFPIAGSDGCGAGATCQATISDGQGGSITVVGIVTYSGGQIYITTSPGVTFIILPQGSSSPPNPGGGNPPPPPPGGGNPPPPPPGGNPDLCSGNPACNAGGGGYTCKGCKSPWSYVDPQGYINFYCVDNNQNCNQNQSCVAGICVDYPSACTGCQSWNGSACVDNNIYCPNGQVCVSGSCTGTNSPTPTNTPPASCNAYCTGNLNCINGLGCYNGVCRNLSCLNNLDCTCNTIAPPIPSGSTNTPTDTPTTPTDTPTPTISPTPVPAFVVTATPTDTPTTPTDTPTPTISPTPVPAFVVTATPTSCTTVRLDWTNATPSFGTTPTSYGPEYKLSSSGTWTPGTSVSNATFTATISGLSALSTYNFRVAAPTARATNYTPTATVTMPSCSVTLNPSGGTISPSYTPTPTVPTDLVCNQSCSGSRTCGTDTCFNGVCRNPSCTSSSTCVCTSTNTPTNTISPTNTGGPQGACTVNIFANPQTMASPGPIFLYWSSTGTFGNCVASGDWSGNTLNQGMDGMVTGVLSSTSTFTLTCRDASSLPCSGSTTVTVGPSGGTQRTVSGTVYLDAGNNSCSSGATPVSDAAISLFDNVTSNPLGTDLTNISGQYVPFTSTTVDNANILIGSIAGNTVKGVRDPDVGAGFVQPYNSAIGYFFNWAAHPSKAIDFCLTPSSQGSWFQTETGDVRFNQINDLVPPNQLASPNIPSSVFFSSIGTSNMTNGTISNSKWLVNREYSSFNNSPTSTIGSTSYSFYQNQVARNGITPIVLPGFLPANLSTGTAQGFYLVNGNVTVSTPINIAPGNKVIVMVNGNLNIQSLIPNQQLITVQPGALLIIAVKGDITIDPTVANVLRDTTETSAALQGIYTAEGNIIIKGASSCPGTPDQKLIVWGSLIANALKPFASGGLGHIINQRSLCANNDTTPSLKIFQRLDFVSQLSDLQKTKTRRWQETNQ